MGQLIKLDVGEMGEVLTHINAAITQLNATGISKTRAYLPTSQGKVEVEVALACPRADMETVITLALRGNLDLSWLLTVMHVDALDQNEKLIGYHGVPLSALAVPGYYTASDLWPMELTSFEIKLMVAIADL